MGRRFVILDAAGTRLIASCVAGHTSAEDLVKRVAGETGESPEKLNATLQNLVRLGMMVNDGSPMPPPKQREGVRIIPESEVPVGAPVDPEGVVRSRRQTLLRPVANGFQVWSPALRAQVILEPDSLAVLPLFAPPKEAVSKALAAAPGGGALEAKRLAAVSRLMAAGVLVPSTLDPVTTTADAVRAAAAAPRKSRPLRTRPEARAGRIPVYSVSVGQAVGLEEYPPLALGLMVAHAKAFQGGALEQKYYFVEDWLDTQASVEEAHRMHGPGVFLFSVYMWCEPQALEISKQIKQRDPRSVIVFGGPSAPKYEEACAAYFKTHRQIDLMVRGEGEVTLSEALAKLGAPLTDAVADGALKEVDGLSYRSRGGAVVRTPERARVKDLEQFPSPYLTGLFDHFCTDDESRLRSMILETNRGCPYGCTFCDWGSATLQKIMKFSMERVRAELEWAGRNKIKRIWCADANFGIFDRDVEIAELIVQTHQKYGYPTQLTVNYAKNATERHAEILRILGKGGVQSEAILSIQSTSEQTLKTIRRQNIKTERYDELAGIFRAEGLPFSSDLMIGLPGDTVESFKSSLQHFFDRDVYVQAYQTVLLPNSPMADPEYIKENKIVTAGNLIIGSYSYTFEDLTVMVRLARYYALMVNWAILKYVLYYLQNDCGLQATDLLLRMVHRFELGDGHTKYPLISWLLSRYRDIYINLFPDQIIRILDAPSSWDEFFAEVKDYLIQECGVKDSPGLQTALAVQAAVLPRESEHYPVITHLQHDFIRYLEDNRSVRLGAPKRPLADYPPGQLVVTDPASLSASVRPEAPERDHSLKFELESGLKPWTPLAPPPPEKVRAAV